MHVEIWADLICPWCGLGQRRLDLALEAFAPGEVTLTHRSYQLDPRATSETRTVRAMLHGKGLSDPQIDATWAGIEAMATADGLTPYILDNVVASTALAHEFLALAAAEGREAAAWTHLYRAYFGQRRPIFTIDDLVPLGEELGLDPAATRTALTDHLHRPHVEADLREARTLGITGVPFVLVDRRLAISGAQSADTFRRALAQARSQST